MIFKSIRVLITAVLAADAVFRRMPESSGPVVHLWTPAKAGVT